MKLKKIYFLGKTEEIAEIEMHKTVSTLVPFEEIAFKSKNQIKLKNGTVYIAIFGGRGAKGIYCDEAYVDRNIDLMTFKDVIYPRVKGRIYIF